MVIWYRGLGAGFITGSSMHFGFFSSVDSSRLLSELIDSFVHRVTVVTSDPLELDSTSSEEFFKAHPKLQVLDGLPIGFDPSSLLPPVDPLLAALDNKPASPFNLNQTR